MNATSPIRLTAAECMSAGELLVAKDRQPFLQGQLEPVAAGDAVAGPVVEILVGDDPLDVDEVGVGRGLAARQRGRGVEDVEALVLHGAEIEIVDRHDLEQVEVVLQAVAVLVPLHRLLQRRHGVVALVDVGVLGVDPQLHRAAGARHELVGEAGEVAGHQREEIGGLGERVLPLRPVPAAGQPPVSSRLPLDSSAG